MTPGPPMALPAGRVLLGWWRDLASSAPRRMWFAHLVLHRVEALVEEEPSRPLAALARAVRPRLAAGARLDELAAELAIDRALLARALAGPADPGATAVRRRSFWFTDEQPPRFVALAGGVTVPLAAPADWQFDPAALRACVAAPAEWKARHGFPAEVRALVGEGSAEGWRHVVLNRAEQATLCLVERRDGAVVGHGTRANGWALAQPAVALPSAEWLSPLVGELGLEALRAAWQAWCQGRGLPGDEVEACALELADHRLIVRPPAKLLERLRAAKSEALRGEAWLLLGGGRVRPAARVEVVG